MKRPCKACGAELLFAQGPRGIPVPLDVASRQHIYELADAIEGLVALKAFDQELYVSHFLTCSSPNRFTRKAVPK